MRFTALFFLASLLTASPAGAQSSQGDDLNLPSYAAPSSGAEPAAGAGTSYGTMGNGPGNGNGEDCTVAPDRPACETACKKGEANGLNCTSKAPLGGLEWLAMAGVGYALHRLRRREDGEDDDGEDGSDALP